MRGDGSGTPVRRGGPGSGRPSVVWVSGIVAAVQLSYGRGRRLRQAVQVPGVEPIADQAGRAELNSRRSSSAAPMTASMASVAAVSTAVAVLRLVASACGFRHTVWLSTRPEAQSAYSSAAQKLLVSASQGTAVSPYQATASSIFDRRDGPASIGVIRTQHPASNGSSRSNTRTS